MDEIEFGYGSMAMKALWLRLARPDIITQRVQILHICGFGFGSDSETRQIDRFNSDPQIDVGSSLADRGQS